MLHSFQDVRDSRGEPIGPLGRHILQTSSPFWLFVSQNLIIYSYSHVVNINLESSNNVLEQRK
jgi:hypothetical protein